MEDECKWPVFRKCCFVVPLKLGVVMIGYWSIVSLVIHAAYAVESMAVTTEPFPGRVWMFYLLHIVVIIVYLILSVMVIVGVYKNKPEYLQNYYISSLVVVVVDLVLVTMAIIWLKQWVAAIYYVFIAMNFYLLLVVRSTYIEMENSDRSDSGAFRRIDKETGWETVQLA